MSLHVMVLGAGGVMGSVAAEDLREALPDATIVAADLSEERVRDALEDAEDRFSLAAVDVTEHEELVDCLADIDVLVNAVGPCYRLGQAVVEAAIEAGTDFVDVCDDYDTTEYLLETYQVPAREAGVTGIVGLGASPGLTNLLAKRAADQLDVVDSILIGVTRSIGAKAGGAIPYHVFHSWLGEVPHVADGERATVQGLRDGEEVIEFPEPFGKLPVYHFGHPETITLPAYLDREGKAAESVSVACKGNFVPETFRDSLLAMYDLGLTETHELTVNGRSLRPIDFAASHLEYVGMKAASDAGSLPTGGAVVVEVSGSKEGNPVTNRYMGTATMRDATGGAAAEGAALLANEDIHNPGVWAPESVLPPDPFVEAFRDAPGFSLWEGEITRSTGRNG